MKACVDAGVESCERDPECTKKTRQGKRNDFLSWDDYFMSVAFLSAMRSKDPSTQVGACIVNKSNRIVGIGYNGFPMGCSDDQRKWLLNLRGRTQPGGVHECVVYVVPWDRTGDVLDTKYPFVCHAEMNAILNKNASDVQDCTMFVALFPCNECAKLIIQSGIKHIVYCSDKYHDDWKSVASRKLLDMAGISYREHKMSNSITIDFSSVQ